MEELLEIIRILFIVCAVVNIILNLFYIYGGPLRTPNIPENPYWNAIAGWSCALMWAL